MASGRDTTTDSGRQSDRAMEVKKMSSPKPTRGVHRAAVSGILLVCLAPIAHAQRSEAVRAEMDALLRRIDVGPYEVPTLVLTHLIPPPRDEADEVSMADELRAAGHQGTIVVARDLTEVSL